MARPISNQIIHELSKAFHEVGHQTDLTYFSYDELVEALRKSPYAYRFDFEKYDAEREAGHTQTDLYFNFIDKGPGSSYAYPTYKKGNVYLRRFTLYYRRNRALPKIESSRYYCNYRTIEQLMAMLAIVVPKIDELEKGILEDEQKDLRLKRIQDIYSATVPDLIKKAFEGSGLSYYYRLGRDMVELHTRLPKNLVATYTLKFKTVSEDLQNAIEATKVLYSTIERSGKVEIERYSANSIQWTET